MGQKGGFTHIHIPLKKAELLVTAVFQYGYLNEKDKRFGIGHLAEHLIVTMIRRNIPNADVWGTIDDNLLIISVLLSKEQFEKHFPKKDLENWISGLMERISASAIKNEKSRIILELQERYGTIFADFSESVRSALIVSPRALARKRNDQIRNMIKFSEEDIKVCLKNILSAPCRVFIGTDNVVSKGNQTEARALLKKRKVRFSMRKRGRISLKRNAEIRNYHEAIAFQVYDTATPLHKRFSVGFAAKEIAWLLEEKIRLLGMNDVYYEYYTDVNYGLVWFGFRSHIPLRGRSLDLLREATVSLFNEEFLDARIKAFKRNKRIEVAADWRDGIARQEWVIEDMIESGKVTDKKETLLALDKVTPDLVRSIVRQVLKTNKACILR